MFVQLPPVVSDFEEMCVCAGVLRLGVGVELRLVLGVDRRCAKMEIMTRITHFCVQITRMSYFECVSQFYPSYTYFQIGYFKRKKINFY